MDIEDVKDTDDEDNGLSKRRILLNVSGQYASMYLSDVPSSIFQMYRRV